MKRFRRWIYAELDLVNVVLLLSLLRLWLFDWPRYTDAVIVGTVLHLLLLFFGWPVVKIVAVGGYIDL